MCMVDMLEYESCARFVINSDRFSRNCSRVGRSLIIADVQCKSKMKTFGERGWGQPYITLGQLLEMPFMDALY